MKKGDYVIINDDGGFASNMVCVVDEVLSDRVMLKPAKAPNDEARAFNFDEVSDDPNRIIAALLSKNAALVTALEEIAEAQRNQDTLVTQIIRRIYRETR